MTPILFKKEPSYEKKHEAYPFQIEAFNAIHDLDYAAIFHEQGLGKTKIAIDLMLYWFEKGIVDTALLVVKKILIRNWIREFEFHTHIRPKLLTQNRKSNFYVFNTPSRVVLTHYEVIRSEERRIQLFLKARDVGIILDESAKIKNPDSALTKVFLRLSPLMKKKVILTGTPVANRPQDIWSQIWFLDYGNSLGNDFTQFKKNVDLSISLADDDQAQRGFEESLERIFDSISDFTVRETKDKNVIKLPQKVFNTVKTDWETAQHDLYEQIRVEERSVILKDGSPTEDKAEEILKRLVRLIQVTSNPRLLDKSYFNKPGKFSDLVNLVESIIFEKEKCIIWTSFVENVDWLFRELGQFNPCKVHGRLKLEIRNKNIDNFVKYPEFKVLIATPGAAKEGLTLTVANHVIFYDRSFSLDDYLQAQDRIHRISQKKICYVYNFIMKSSIDEWIEMLLHNKRLAAQLSQGDISKEYFRSQIDYDFGDIIKGILHNRD